jgi:hypothetical protein
MVLTAITTYLHKMGLSRHKCQSWMCQGCKKTFGAKDQLLVDAKKKELALRMYAEGIAARKIERLLGVSHNAVLGWVRKEVASKALKPVPADEVQVVEADEMWSFIGSKSIPSGCAGPSTGPADASSAVPWEIGELVPQVCGKRSSTPGARHAPTISKA